jgi:hypothetical protein
VAAVVVAAAAGATGLAGPAVPARLPAVKRYPAAIHCVGAAMQLSGAA